MSLKLICSTLGFVAIAVTSPASVRADSYSKNNPYRSFNISGNNYGADQWERDHRPQAARPSTTPTRPRRGILFRRR